MSTCVQLYQIVPGWVQQKIEIFWMISIVDWWQKKRISCYRKHYINIYLYTNIFWSVWWIERKFWIRKKHTWRAYVLAWLQWLPGNDSISLSLSIPRSPGEPGALRHARPLRLLRPPPLYHPSHHLLNHQRVHGIEIE